MYTEKIEQAYIDLANAIILQAVYDYRKLKHLPDHTIYEKKKIKDIEGFFVSKWFRRLTNVDGVMLRDILREEKTYECANHPIHG